VLPQVYYLDTLDRIEHACPGQKRALMIASSEHFTRPGAFEMNDAVLADLTAANSQYWRLVLVTVSLVGVR